MIRGLIHMYSFGYVRRLVGLYIRSTQQYGAYLRAFWRTADFGAIRLPQDMPLRHRFAIAALRGCMLLQVLVAAALALLAWQDRLAGGWYFAAAVLVAIPLTTAHALPLAYGLWWLLHPKALGRAVICSVLEAQVRRLRAAHDFSVVAVAGSVGKTSTKIAVARLLGAARRVQWQEGNYNDRVTVPLIFFGHTEPAIYNVFAWLRIIARNERIIRQPYPYQVVVVELGTDGPGFMQEFAYSKPDVGIITAVTPEHMEFFGTIEAVAQEELALLHYTKRVLVNIDDTDAVFLRDRSYTSYGTGKKADYRAEARKDLGIHGQEVRFHLRDDKLDVAIPLLGGPGAKIALAAAASAHMLGIPLDDIRKGLADISAFAGRMRVLPGIKNSTIIDDTYNASPVAVRAALDILQGGPAPQRIAILGAMNELGAYSPRAHREAGEYCDPTKLDWVITIGHDANTYLAPVAEERGCKVKTFTSPYDAGAFIKEILQDEAVILAKGSQNRVFAEEALKVLLADPADEAKLVRQSAYWLAIKRKQFRP